jgi:uncharacterized protein (DUF58 family)
MTPRPTRACVAPLLVAVVLHLLTRVTGDGWLALGSAAALGLPLASLVLRPQAAGLTWRLVEPARAAAGEVVPVRLLLRNAGARATTPLTLLHEHPGLSALEVHVPALAPGEVHEVTATRTAGRRGVHEGGTVRLTTSAPFGVVRWSQTRPEASVVVVHPVTATARTAWAGGGSATAERSVPVAGSGTEPLGLRPWRPGDAARSVLARATARHGRPVVLEREQETGPSLVVLAVGGGAGPRWEQAVSATASLALAALRDGVPPHLLPAPSGARCTEPVALLDFFAAVDAAGPLRPADLATARPPAGPGGRLVLLAPAGADTTAVRSAAAAARCHVEVPGG